jgi:hypothetical protein
MFSSEPSHTQRKNVSGFGSILTAPAWIILVAELAGTVAGMLHVENGYRKRLQHEGILHMSVRPRFSMAY